MTSWIDDEAEAFEAAARPLSARAAAARPAPYLDGLNPDQRAAVEALDGPVLVLAGAGTGKTRALTTRIAHLLNTGRARPNEILAVTFTNKAAREMKARVGGLVGGVVEGMPWLGTFHSLSVRILRRNAELVGLKSNFTILDVDDQLRLLRQIVQAHRIDEKRWPPRLLAGLIDGWKNRALTPDRVPASEVERLQPPGRRALRRVPGAAARPQRLRLRRPADARPRHPAGPPGRAGAVPALVPLHPRRRVPGHQRRAVPVAAAARGRPTATSASSATTTSRSTAGAAPRSATSCASRRTSPGRSSSASSRTTARPRTSSPPPPA